MLLVVWDMLLVACEWWKQEVGIGNTVTALGVWLAFVQLRRGVRQERAKFLMELTARYFADNDVRRFYYKLEEEGDRRFIYDPKKFAGSPEERWLDQLLYSFDVIGWVVRKKLLKSDEAEIFAFQALQVLENPEVIKYLAWLDEAYASKGRPVPAHKAAKFLVETLNNCGQRKPIKRTPSKSGGQLGS